jgi:outer membrane receptor protein involved in Fe transport
MKVSLARVVALAALALACLGMFTTPALAGTTGKISGRVVDAATGETLPGANIRIEGTTMGAMSDVDGSFYIINVPPGEYTVSAEFIGFATDRKSGVSVSIDRTTEMTFRMQSEALDIGLVIETEVDIPIIRRDVTASARTLTGERLAILPVKTVEQALETNVGFVQEGGELHVRGGRSGEVLYLVDGMPISDPLVGGGQAIQVSSANIKELEILAGGFNAEYGSAQSAIINIVTKEGNVTEYHGHMEYLTDDLGSTSLNDYSFNSDRFEFSLSGPEPITTYLFPNMGIQLPGKNISLYLAADVDKTDSWVNYDNADYGTHEYMGGLFELSERRRNYHTATAKLTWWMRDNFKFSVGWNKSWDRWTAFQWDHRYVPDWARYYEQNATNLNFNVNHTLSSELFYELNIARFALDYEVTPGGRLPDWFALEDQHNDFWDQNANGIWDPGEAYTDVNGNGVWDAGEPYVDANGNDHYDAPEPLVEDGDGNGVYDPELRDWTNIDRPEPYVDGEPFVDLAESYTDENGNGIYDFGEPFVDANYNGQWDAANGVYDAGTAETFTDLNGNGEWDAPNGVYDEGEIYYDVNGNGRWDDSDSFFDWGTDRWAFWQNRSMTIWTAKGDVTWAPSTHHTFKSGIETRVMDFTMQESQYNDNAWTGTPRDSSELYFDRGVFIDFYDYAPTQLALYLQDKMEYGQMIVNAGLRLDYFIQAPVAIFVIEEGALVEQSVDNNAKLSPRLGISYPITTNAKVYFSYGHFYQLPELQYMYQGQTEGASASAIHGNPYLDYEKTVAYEFGVDYAFGRDWRVDVKGFYKDIYGLINSLEQQIANQISRYYSNADYGRVRGIELTLEKRYSNYFSADLSYLYSFAYGKSSDETSNYYDAFYGRPISVREWPLDWDQRHQVTATVDFRAADGDHPEVFGLTLPDNWGLNFLINYGSGFPFTPSTDHPDVHVTRAEEVEPNSMRRPWTMTVDMKFNKDFSLWGIDYSFILWIENLFDKENVRNVHANTGLPYTNTVVDGVIITDRDQIPEYQQNPTNYDAGRNVRIGFALRF